MSNKNNLAKVYHFDLYGKREDKYEFLNENSLDTIEWNELTAEEPNFFFVKKNFITNNEYASFLKITDLFKDYSAGIQSKRDGLFINENKTLLGSTIKKLICETLDPTFINEYNIKDSSSYQITKKIKQVNYSNEYISRIHYRPFDDRFIYYDANLIGRAFHNIMKNLKFSDNIGLVISKQFNDNFKYAFISNKICDMNLISNAGSFGAGFSFPLYLYPETSGQQSTEETAVRKPNLNPAIVQEIAERLRLEFVPEKGTLDAINRVSTGTFAPIDILDYVYAVLHSPTYREKYKEFLKIDFPRVPYPKDQDTFWQLVKLGGELRQIHLLESAVVEKPITQYPIGGDNVVEKISFSFSPKTNLETPLNLPKGETFEDWSSSSPLGRPGGVLNSGGVLAPAGVVGKVYINDTQYFDNVPEVAWNFYIGGYQPSQKWLKDRKGRVLAFEDILHYQKIIVALTQTDRIMKEIDKIEIHQEDLQANWKLLSEGKEFFKIDPLR